MSVYSHGWLLLRPDLDLGAGCRLTQMATAIGQTTIAHTRSLKLPRRSPNLATRANPTTPPRGATRVHPQGAPAGFRSEAPWVPSVASTIASTLATAGGGHGIFKKWEIPWPSENPNHPPLGSPRLIRRMVPCGLVAGDPIAVVCPLVRPLARHSRARGHDFGFV